MHFGLPRGQVISTQEYGGQPSPLLTLVPSPSLVKFSCSHPPPNGRRLDMLPALLSEQLCSLRSGAERLAVSVLWTLDEASLEVLDTWMGRTIISSRHQLSYQQASDIEESREQDIRCLLRFFLVCNNNQYYISTVCLF